MERKFAKSAEVSPRLLPTQKKVGPAASVNEIASLSDNIWNGLFAEI